MNLRDQLRQILPEILSENPTNCIKGTELIRLVKYRLNQDYSDATLRYHFSIMSCDPSSPIAKVEQGQGYYLRSTTIHSLNSARNLLGVSQTMLGQDLTLSAGDQDLAIARANKFRAVVNRYFESVNRFALAFERSFSDRHAGSNRWRFPDMVALEWLVGELDEDGGFHLCPDQLEVRRRMGDAPMRLTSVKLKLETNYDTLREDLFQCLSASGWANNAEMMVAAPVDDEHLVEEIRQFASRYGVGVTTFGLDADILDDMPEPAAIANLMPREFEAIQSLFRLRRISSSRVVDRFDWQHIVDQQDDQADYALLIRWVSHCLLHETAVSVAQFEAIEEKQAAVEKEEDAASAPSGEQVA